MSDEILKGLADLAQKAANEGDNATAFIIAGFAHGCRNEKDKVAFLLQTYINSIIEHIIKLNEKENAKD